MNLNRLGKENHEHKNTKDLWSIVMVELTSYCNFSCSFCPSDSMRRRKTMMPRSLWEKILHELGEKQMTRTVFFHVLGEPLMHRDVFDAIRLANHLDLSVSLYTNGALLDDKRSLKLLGALRKGRIVLSMQEISPQNFPKRCRGAISWKNYIARLQNFMKLAETYERPIPVQVHCMIDMRAIGWNIPRILREQRRLQALYDQWVKTLGGESGRKINVFDPTASYNLGKRGSFFVKHAGNWDNQLIDEELEVLPLDNGHCALMTDTFAVLSDGTCTYCCDDYEGKLSLGNASEKSLAEIYHGDKATRIREAERKDVLIEEHCRICRGILRYKKNKKPVPSRNLLTDYFVSKEHLSRYGLKSAAMKTMETLQKRVSGRKTR